MRITKMNVLLNDDYSVALVREYSTNYKDIGEVKNPKAVVQVMRDVFKIHKQAEEYLFLVSMTKKCRPIGFFEISHGTHDATLMGMREIFIRALLSGAANIIIAHNHPSGNCEPSQIDILITREIEKASELMGVEFCDHIIIGTDDYYSFCEEGKIAQEKTGRNLKNGCI